MNAALCRAIKYFAVGAITCNALVLTFFIAGTAINLSNVLQQAPRMFQDFMRYYTAGTIAVQGPHERTYDRAFQKQKIVEVVHSVCNCPIPDQYDFPIDYLPMLFTLMAPLALLPVGLALPTFLILSLMIVVGGYFLLSDGDAKRAGLWVLAVAASGIFWRTLAMGQVSWLISGLLAAYAFALLTKKDAWAGVALALLAVFKIQYAPYLGLPLLLDRRWKALAALAVAGVAILVVTAVVMSPDLVAAYPKVLAHVESNDPAAKQMICARALFLHLMPKAAASLAGTIGTVIGLLGVACIWWSIKTSDQKVNDKTLRWALALTVQIALLTSPHVHNYDLLLLAVPAMLTMPTLDFCKILEQESPLFRAWCLLFWLFPITSWALLRIPDSDLGWQVGGFVAMQLIMIAIAFLCFRSSRGYPTISHD